AELPARARLPRVHQLVQGPLIQIAGPVRELSPRDVPFRFAGRTDPWLSGLMDRACLAVSPSGGSENGELRRRLETEAVFASAKIATSAVGTVHELERAGFHAVDVLVSFEGPAAGLLAYSHARFARAADRDAVVALARRAFQFTRFHLDPEIPDALADE